VICRDCFYCWKDEFRSGKYLEIKDVIWRCMKKAGNPVVYKLRQVRSDVLEEQRFVSQCTLYTPPPWKNSKKFERWKKEGVVFNQRSTFWREIRA